MKPRRAFGVSASFGGIVAALLSVGLLGCSGGTGTVSGNVTIDGKPVPDGTIVFVPPSSPPVAAMIKNGSYTAEGVPTGEVKVTVETESVKQRLMHAKAAQRGEAVAGGVPKAQFGGKSGQMPPEAKAYFEKMKSQAAGQGATYVPVPDRYKDAQTSGLSLTVTSGQNTYNVPLTSK